MGETVPDVGSIRNKFLRRSLVVRQKIEKKKMKREERKKRMKERELLGEKVRQLALFVFLESRLADCPLIGFVSVTIYQSVLYLCFLKC